MHSSPRQPGFLDKLSALIVGLGIRMMVHAFAFIMALFGFSTLALPGGSGVFDSIAIGFGIYIGLICLFPRGMKRNADWLVPVLGGLCLMLLWWLAGIPWQFSAIWSGAATWLIRQLVKRCQIDWDFAVLPWLLICLYNSFASLLPALPRTPPWWSFFVVCIGGWLGTELYIRLRGDSSQRKLLSAALEKIAKRVGTRTLPREIEDAAIDMQYQGRLFLKRWPRFGKESAGLVNDFALRTESLDSLNTGSAESAVQKQLAGMKRIVSSISERLSELERKHQEESPQAAVDKALTTRIGEFRDSATQLLDKSQPLSLKVRRCVDGIARSTEKILVSMRDDPQDVLQADRFLSRYLRAAHSIVEEYARLSSQASTHPAINETLIRSENLLERLEAAFATEYASLLQNDTLNFTAELNVLDKLLSMEGK